MVFSVGTDVMPISVVYWTVIRDRIGLDQICDTFVVFLIVFSVGSVLDVNLF